uniref:NmrA-like domain-containing protein n=1 Tax=Haptolina ericina TaxID=156174 RepID=A0A7S3B3G4_9EUKA
MVVVVAGATGHVGLAAVNALVAQGVEVRALTRKSTSEAVAPLRELSKVQIVECNLSDGDASLATVFSDATAALLTCANFRGQVDAEKAFIDAAVAGGCPYLVKLATVQCYTAKDSPCEYARFHAEINEYCERVAGSMKVTTLCPNWFMTNHLADIFGTLPQSIIAYPVVSEAKATIVDPRDVGDVAAALLMTPDPSKYHGLTLDVAGPESTSMAQLAALYADTLGRPVKHVMCPMEAWIAAGVQAGLPDWLAQAVSLNFGYWEAGELAFESSPEVLALAPPKRTMSEWIHEWAPRSPPASA